MRARDLLFAAGGLALIAAAVTIAGSPATGSAPESPQAPPAPPVADHGPPSPELSAPAPAAGEAAAAADPDAAPSGPRTEGMIRGHLSLAPGLARTLQSVLINVTEIGHLEQPPFARTVRVPIDASASSPRFAIDGIPFTEHEYRVQAHAEGHNGSQQTIRLTADQPVADVVLGVSLGAFVTVMLRDQQRAPVTDLPVMLVPVGEPPGRRMLRATADNFGSAQFDGVLSGPYKVVAGDLTAPRNAETIFDVLPGERVQSTMAIVPRGFAFKVIVQSANGWGVRDAAVELLSLDAKVHREHTGVTDVGGNCALEHVPPGYYQINVNAPGHERWSRNVTIAAEQAPEPMRIQLFSKTR
jgi:hypothetical protein